MVQNNRGAFARQSASVVLSPHNKSMESNEWSAADKCSDEWNKNTTVEITMDGTPNNKINRDSHSFGERSFK